MRASEEPAGRWSSECPYCAQRLKGMEARGLGVCSDCGISLPGSTADRARALVELVARAASEDGGSPEELVSTQAMLRLLYRRPETREGVAATTGVHLHGKWASAAGEILKG